MSMRDWRSSRKIENEFKRSLDIIVNALKRIADSSKGNEKVYKEKMSEFQESFSFKKFILSSVKRMVTPIGNESYSTWRKAARKQSKSNLIYRTLLSNIKDGLQEDINEQVKRNASLISTLPNDVAEKVSKDISRYTFEGKRSTTIENLIKDKTEQHAGASARLIARTEVSKTTTALTRARAEKIGLKWYIWQTAEDGDRVRKSHQKMQGVLVNWDDPPSPELLIGEKFVGNYHAGEIWNCRCYPEPLLDIDEIKWPAKVYMNGSIKTVRKPEFEKLM